MLEKHRFSMNTIVFLRSQPSLSDDQDPKKFPSWGLPGVTMGRGRGRGEGGRGRSGDYNCFLAISLPTDSSAKERWRRSGEAISQNARYIRHFWQYFPAISPTQAHNSRGCLKSKPARSSDRLTQTGPGQWTWQGGQPSWADTSGSKC